MTHYAKLLGSTDMPMASYPWDEDEMNHEARFPPTITPGLQDDVRHGVSHFGSGRSEFGRAATLLRTKKIDEEQKIEAGWKP